MSRPGILRTMIVAAEGAGVVMGADHATLHRMAEGIEAALHSFKGLDSIHGGKLITLFRFADEGWL